MIDHLNLSHHLRSGDDTVSQPLNLDAISREWLRVCGPHDYGMPVADCACPEGDPRSVISRLVTEIERLRAERAADAGRIVSAARAWRDGRRDRVGGEIYRRQCRALYAAVNALDEEITPAEPAVPRRVPTQAERIADAIADGHHRITEGRQTATDAMSDRYGETLDLIATAVETATDDTLRDSIRSMIRRVRPEALDLWSATPARRPTSTEETDRD